MPCFRAFFADWDFPSGVFGPELRAAFFLLASTFFGLVMMSAVVWSGARCPRRGWMIWERAPSAYAGRRCQRSSSGGDVVFWGSRDRRAGRAVQHRCEDSMERMAHFVSNLCLTPAGM